MKRAITLILLAITLLSGGISMDARTARERQKTRTGQSSSSSSSFNMKSLIDKIYAMNKEVRLSISQVKTLMKNFGFTYQSSYKTKVTDDYDEICDVDVLKFTKSGVSAEVYVGHKFIFKFSNSSEAKKFITASKNAFGNALKKRDTEYLYYKYMGSYYWHMEQQGSTVTIEFGESMDGGGSYYSL